MNLKNHSESSNFVLTAESQIGLYQQNRYWTYYNYAKSSVSV